MYLPYVSDLCEILMPRRCASCGCRLLPSEGALCMRCVAALPRVRHWNHGNPAEHRLFGRLAFGHGASFCFYLRDSAWADLLKKAKYGGCPWVNSELARLVAAELTEWPYDADVIVPIPIHWFRRLRRGYNQTEYIARTLGKCWHLPVETRCLVKSAYTSSQVGNSYDQRLARMEGTFSVRHPERLEGRHLLLVDDVLTSGATLIACGQALQHTVPNVRISFLTLGMVP